MRDHPRQLLRRGLMADHAREREPADDRIGHPRIGELPDVSGDPIQLVERPAPAPRTSPTGRDQKAVDVEEDRLWSIHSCPACTSGRNVAQTSDLSELACAAG